MALFSRLFHPTTRHPRREERQGRGAWVPVDVGSVSLDVLCFLKRKGKRCLTQHGRSWHRSNTSRCLKLQPFENGPSVFLDRVSVRRLIDDSHCRVRGESLGGRGGGARAINRPIERVSGIGKDDGDGERESLTEDGFIRHLFSVNTHLLKSLAGGTPRRSKLFQFMENVSSSGAFPCGKIKKKKVSL